MSVAATRRAAKRILLRYGKASISKAEAEKREAAGKKLKKK